ncbi:hypothetical protein FACS1894170_00160 [Planctomycetales bacterium]|nr:hypothetical protein FACS1894170_00160 [Planctomycetales bacterium]
MLRIIVTFSVLISFAASLCAGSEPETLCYRRWLAPLDKIEHWPFSPGLNVPINRQLFEQYITDFVTKNKFSDSSAAVFFKTVLTGELDENFAASGSGTFELPAEQPNPDLIPLEVLKVPMMEAKWNDGTEASFVCNADGLVRLVVPNHNVKRLDFRWSLQNTASPGLHTAVFTVTLPLSLQTELHFDIPESVIASSANGITSLEAGINPQHKLFNVFLGQQTGTTLTFQSPVNKAVADKTPYRQTTSYWITEQGLDLTVHILPDAADNRLTELFAVLEQPLHIIDIWCGENRVAWEALPDKPTDVIGTLIRIDLPDVSKDQLQDITIRAMAPVQENTDWQLPRCWIRQDNVFWRETRCGVNVFTPMQTVNVSVTGGVQVTPRTVVDWSQRELHTFQLSQPDAPITVNVRYNEPQTAFQSATQIVWRTNEIRANTVLECSLAQGQQFAVEIPVSEDWSIDFVKSVENENEQDNIASWSIITGSTESECPVLQIQFKRPLQAKKTVALQLTGRYLKNTQTKFSLGTLLLVKLPLRKPAIHYIGVQLGDMPFHLRSSAVAVPAAAEAAQNLLQTLTGNVYVLDSGTQKSELELIRSAPNYSAEISEEVRIENAGMKIDTVIRCQPNNSSVDRIYVHFLNKLPNDDMLRWSSVQSHLAVLRARKLTDDDLQKLLPVFRLPVRLEKLQHGETWEIQLPAPQTEPFDISVTAAAALNNSVEIPLMVLMSAVSQNAVVRVSSPYRFDYRVVNSQLQSIPTTASAWNQYSEVLAAFRYNPAELLFSADGEPLLLQKTASEKTVSPASIWSLRLNSQYEPDGNVNNDAFFCIENNGKDAVTVTLPDRTDIKDITSVLCDGRSTNWHSGQVTENDGTVRATVTVPLPVGKRFVTMTIEYIYQDVPLAQQHKFRQRELSADIPILSRNRAVWFPPDFAVSLRNETPQHRHSSVSSPPQSFEVSRCLAYWHGIRGFNPVSVGDWQQLLTQHQRHNEAATVAKLFFEEVDGTLKKNPIISWSGLLKNEKMVQDVIFRNGQGTDVKLLVDKQAFRSLGITPETPITGLVNVPQRSLAEELFNRSGLVLIVSSRTRADNVKEYTLAITAAMQLPLYREFQTQRIGQCIRFAAPQMFSVSGQTAAAKPTSPNLSRQPDWDAPLRWISETVLSAAPWLTTPPFASAFNADWNAVELPANQEHTLYIVHRETMTALQWLAFLAAVVLTSRKPFSSPIWILLLLFAAEMTARLVADCYVMLPSGVFLGLCVSLGFSLIRSRLTQQHILIPLIPAEPLRDDRSTEHDEMFVPTVMPNREFVTGILIFLTGILCLTATAAAQELTVPDTKGTALSKILSAKEAYRVFYPTDAEKQIIGNEVWLPLEFLNILSQPKRTVSGSHSEHVSIIRAEYSGSLIRNSTLQHIEAADDFTAEFTVLLDGEHVEIPLGRLPVKSATWNGNPIEARQRFDNHQPFTSFVIDNANPGTHVLKVSIQCFADEPANEDTRNQNVNRRLTFPVPRIPNSSLHLNVPDGVNDVYLSGNYGAVTRKTENKPVLSAMLGSTDTISIHWTDRTDSDFVQQTNVEEYFLLHAKAEQTELKVLFRFNFSDASTNQVSIKTDPQWLRSGQFQCSTVPISSQRDGDITQVTFLTPPSGTVSIFADFVLKDFNGIGNVLLPQFQVLEANVTKKMIAVSAANNLELLLPLADRSSMFMSGWYGEDVLYSDDVSPVAEYDVTVTPPDWFLGIRAKSALPKIKLIENVLFDTNESVFVTVNEIETASEIFQLPFVCSKSLTIDNIEVRDSQNVIIENRFSEINTVSKSAEAEALFFGKLFLKRSVIGKMTITVNGSFVSDTTELKPIPVFTFTNGDISARTLNLYRSNSVITEIADDQSDWKKSLLTPGVPKDIRQRITAASADKPVQAVPIRQYESEVTEAVKDRIPVMPRVLVKANKPQFSGKTLLALNHVNNAWQMVYDLSGEVTGGEINGFRFIWDNNCQNIETVQVDAKSCDWSLEPSGEHSVLTLTPKTPITGSVHVQIVASLAPNGGDVSVPVILPESEMPGLEMFVQLPQKTDGKPVSWKTQFLKLDEKPNIPLNNQDGIITGSPLLYSITERGYSAKTVRTSSLPTVELNDISFLLRSNGAFFGLSTIDVKVRGKTDCIVRLPAGCELLQITRDGHFVQGTKLPDNCWHVDFWDSDYPQRWSFLFRSNQNKNDFQRSGVKPQKQQSIHLQFPIFDGLQIQETIWTFAGEIDGNQSECSVQTFKHYSDSVTAVQRKETAIHLGRHRFLTGVDVLQPQIAMNLIRQRHMLRLLNSLPVDTAGRTDDLKRWYSLWSAQWNNITEKLDFQTPLTANIPNPKQAVILNRDDMPQQADSATSAGAFLATISPKTREAFMLAKQQSVREKIGDAIAGTQSHSKQPETAGAVPILTSPAYWQGRISSESGYLFGICNGTICEICLSGGLREQPFSSVVPSVFLSLLLMILMFAVLVYLRGFLKELFLQFPHFWGICIGLLLWFLLHLGGVGVIVIVLIVLSLFRPSWKRRKIPQNQL